MEQAATILKRQRALQDSIRRCEQNGHGRGHGHNNNADDPSELPTP